MLVSEFDYNLPEELIAQTPSKKREDSRMMVLDKQAQTIEHKHFYDIVDYLDDNCILVLNNTKVIPARLYAHKETGALIETFLLNYVSPSLARNLAETVYVMGSIEKMRNQLPDKNDSVPLEDLFSRCCHINNICK